MREGESSQKKPDNEGRKRKGILRPSKLDCALKEEDRHADNDVQ